MLRSFEGGTVHLINGAMIRCARGLLGWSARTLAQRSHVGIATIQRIEAAKFAVCGQNSTIHKIEHALVDANVHFTENAAGEIGVHIKS